MDLLDSEKDQCPVMKVCDIRKYTLLTFCAFKNSLTALKIIYEHARHYDEAELHSSLGRTCYADWVN